MELYDKTMVNSALNLFLSDYQSSEPSTISALFHPLHCIDSSSTATILANSLYEEHLRVATFPKLRNPLEV